MRNDPKPKRRFRAELETTLEQMAKDIERAGDAIRRRTARELRDIGPTIVKASESVATTFARTAENIDRALRSEGKRPSGAPRPQRNTRPGY